MATDTLAGFIAEENLSSCTTSPASATAAAANSTPATAFARIDVDRELGALAIAQMSHLGR